MNMTLLSGIAFIILGVLFTLSGIFQKSDFNLKESWYAKQYSIVFGSLLGVVGIIISLANIT